MSRLAIIGAGSWGAALSIALAPRFSQVRLWVYEKDLAERMRESRVNDLYLPSARIADNVEPVTDLAAALEGAEIVLSVMPSHLVRSLYSEMLPSLSEEMIFVSATKGLENGSLLRMTEVIRRVVGKRFEPKVAVISGPTFAAEVARLEPSALVAASEDAGVAARVQQSFAGPMFRLYTSSDPVGVEIGGAIKNVVALGAGVLNGLGLGQNVTAALITRGLAEMTRLSIAMGGHPRTMSGLAGLGDLVLTCTGQLSRNRSVGIALAQGRKLDEIVGSMNMVAEGVKTTAAAVDLARRHAVEMPIAEQMFQILHFDLPPREAMQRLMERSLKGE